MSISTLFNKNEYNLNCKKINCLNIDTINSKSVQIITDRISTIDPNDGTEYTCIDVLGDPNNPMVMYKAIVPADPDPGQGQDLNLGEEESPWGTLYVDYIKFSSSSLLFEYHYQIISCAYEGIINGSQPFGDVVFERIGRTVSVTIPFFGPYQVLNVSPLIIDTGAEFPEFYDGQIFVSTIPVRHTVANITTDIACACRAVRILGGTFQIHIYNGYTYGNNFAINDTIQAAWDNDNYFTFTYSY